MRTHARPGSPAHPHRPPQAGLPPTSRAVVQRRFGPPSRLAVRDVPMPRPTGEQVLVRVAAASVNAQDWHIMRGEPRIARLLAPAVFRLRSPRQETRGTDFAGTVVAVGPEVTRWRPGDRVFGQGTGTFAEYAVAESDEIASLPSGLDATQAAAIPLAAATALQCLESGARTAGTTILVNGASGGVGTYAVQIARTMGLRVTAVVSPRHIELAKRLGAEKVVDYTAADFAELGRQFDVVLDLVGNRSLADLRRSARPGGSLVLSGGGVPGTGRVIGPFRLMVQAQLQSRRSDVRVYVPKAQPTTERLERLAGLWSAGQIEPIIDRTYPLAQAAAALDYMETVHPQGKVVVQVS